MWSSVAACVVILIGLTVYFKLEKKSTIQIAQNSGAGHVFTSDVLPGGDKAVLTLADGSTIVLSEAQNGTLAQQGHSKLIKLNNGRLAYSTGTSGTNEKKILYNTISTPRGGQYQVELPDGSQVWLNAASSIRFPAEFSGMERRVEITGEAYFEVMKSSSKPFVVKVNESEVQVMGTHFNIMAYPDEASVETTLLEGSVKFVKEKVVNVLKPGQQSQLSKDGRLRILDVVNTEDVMAWKNGLFNFKGEDIGLILRQLSRWYDVEIVYEKVINDHFYAEIPRNTKLSDILRALELTGKVHFRIDGKKIIVLP